MVTLLVLNTIGSQMGKVDFDSFWKLHLQRGKSSFHVYESFSYSLIGIIGGLTEAVLTTTTPNERNTKWRIKTIHHSKRRRFLEVLAISLTVDSLVYVAPHVNQVHFASRYSRRDRKRHAEGTGLLWNDGIQRIGVTYLHRFWCGDLAAISLAQT